MVNVSCTYVGDAVRLAECCSVSDCSPLTFTPWQLIPHQYQGWFVLLLLLIGIVVIPYVFYLMLGEKPDV